MADESGYQSRIMPQAGTPGPMASPDDFGAQVGRALGDLGDAVHRGKVQDFRIARKVEADRQAAEFAKRWALQRQNMDGVVQHLRTNPSDPSYSTHAKQATDALDGAREGLLDGITEGEVRRRAETQINEYSGELGSREYVFAQGKATAKLLGDASDAVDIAANRVRRMQGEDPNTLTNELKAAYELGDGLQNVDPEAKKKFREYADQRINTAYIQHLQDVNPRGAKAMLDSGAFDFLPPPVLEQLRSGTDVEIRRADAAVASEAAAVKATYKDALGAARTDAGNGIDVSDRLPALYKQAEALGDQGDMAAIKGLERESRFAKVFKGIAPLARQSRVQELQAIAEAKRSEDQKAELAWLVEKGPGLDSQWNSDPLGVVLRNGRPGEQPPPLDPANPASYAARAGWTRRAAQQYGSMLPLTDAEKQAREVQYKQGVIGQKAVADDLSQFGPGISRLAAQQLAPNDRFLQEVVRLPADTRDDAYEGKAASAADKTLLKTWASDDDTEYASTVLAGFDQAMASVPQAQRNAIREVAWNLAAAEVKRGQPLTGALFEKSLNRAIGADYGDGKQRGGIAGWTGRQFFVVPDGYTANAFATELFGWLRKYPGEAPVNPDGKPLDLKQARPVRLANGMYKFMVGENDVKNRKGGPFVYKPGWR